MDLDNWFTAQQIAGLPGLPATDRRIRAKADREGWKRRKRLKGKGFEYHFTTLPAKAQKALLAESKSGCEIALDEPADELVVVREVGELNDKQRGLMTNRLLICDFIDDLAKSQNLKRRVAIELFLGRASAGELPENILLAIQKANFKQQGTLSQSTIYRWFQRKEKGTAELANCSRVAKAPPAWLPKLLALYQNGKYLQKPSVAQCIAFWPKAYDCKPPHLRTAQTWLARMPKEIREYGRMGKNALRAVQPFIRRTTQGLWPMDVVTVDGHLFKAYVRHPITGRKFRPEMTTYLDVATRKAVGMSAWIAESSYAIGIAFRSMATNPECGIPAIHYSDNGAYRSDEMRGIVARVGTTIMFSQAYRAQARGMIERLNSSVWVPFARTFQTYVNDDADPETVKKQMKLANQGENLMEWSDFVQQAQLALQEYNDRPHSGLTYKSGRTHISPNEAWQQAVDEGWQPTELGQDHLYDVLPSVERVTLRGEVQLPWGLYFADALRSSQGQKVRVSIQPDDGQRVWVSDADGRLLAEAKLNGNCRPYVAHSQMEHALEQRKKARLRRVGKEIDAIRAESGGLNVIQVAVEDSDDFLNDMTAEDLRQMRKNLDYQAI
jgi:putative transposase